MFVPTRLRHRRSRGCLSGCLGAIVRGLILLALLLAAGVGWYYSNLILGPDAPPPLAEQTVYAATDTTVTLSATADAIADGVWALEWEGGYGRLSDVLGRRGDQVTRRFHPVVGRPPVGQRASARPYAFAADPQTLLGVPFDVEGITTPAGDCPAWVVKASADSDWAILVHGRGAVRAQALALTPLFLGLGWNCLIPSYRNDSGASSADGGRYRLGATEWRDLEATVRWARERGAKHIVLVGYSMGATIALQFMRHSALAAHVDGLVLESPLLRWRPVFDLAAKERGVPPWVTTLAMFVTQVRTGIDWNDLDLVAHANDFRTPVLLFHGTADRKVPIAVSESLAARRPDRVTLVRVIGAGHVRCWNVDPAGFEAAVTSWMKRLPTPSP